MFLHKDLPTAPSSAPVTPANSKIYPILCAASIDEVGQVSISAAY